MNQDYSVSTENIAVILDGCGSGEHSEIGSSRMGEAIRKNSSSLDEKILKDLLTKLCMSF